MSESTDPGPDLLTVIRYVTETFAGVDVVSAAGAGDRRPGSIARRGWIRRCVRPLLRRGTTRESPSRSGSPNSGADAAGITNASIRAALVDLLGKPIADSTALCIPQRLLRCDGTAAAHAHSLDR